MSIVYGMEVIIMRQMLKVIINENGKNCLGVKYESIIKIK